jgi:hypothetical protein
MTNEVTVIEIVTDGGWRAWVGLLPWASTLLVPVIVLRSLFLLRFRESDRARRCAARCFLGLHLQSAFALVTGTWMALRYVFLLNGHTASGETEFSMKNVNMSHALWLVAYQCFIATVGALTVAACSGFRPRLWHPRFAIASIILALAAEAMSLGLFEFMRW